MIYMFARTQTFAERPTNIVHNCESIQKVINQREAAERARGSFSLLALRQTREENNLVIGFKMTVNNFIYKLDQKKQNNLRFMPCILIKQDM